MEDEDKRTRVRSWLNAQRKEMPHGVLVLLSQHRDPPTGKRGSAAYGRWDEGTLLYLFASEEDRDEFRASLPEDTVADDPGDATKVQG